MPKYISAMIDEGGELPFAGAVEVIGELPFAASVVEIGELPFAGETANIVDPTLVFPTDGAN